jgi:hypothetical protein
MDYRDHRPDLNPKLFELLASGVGLRQSSRLLGSACVASSSSSARSRGTCGD